MATNVLKKIEKNQWTRGVTRQGNILLLSIGLSGQNEILIKEFGRKYFQNRIFFSNEKKVSRILGLFSLEQIHKSIKTKILRNPGLLDDLIKRDFSLLKKMKKKSDLLLKNFTENGFEKNIANLFEIIELQRKHNYLFFLIFVMGLQLHKNKQFANNKKQVDLVLKKHDFWRNNDTKIEQKFEINIKKIFLLISKDVNFENKNDIFYTDIFELYEIFDKQRIKKSLLKKIKNRKKAFAYIALDEKYFFIDDLKQIKSLKTFFDKYFELSKLDIKGSVAFADELKIKGKVLIIKNPKNKYKFFKDTVLVAEQTTPDYMFLMNKVKAIITDEGGITSHAAIIARELKIPCIIATQNATKVLKTGDSVEMDMISGVIKKV